jgi:hypothetical protein
MERLLRLWGKVKAVGWASNGLIRAQTVHKECSVRLDALLAFGIVHYSRGPRGVHDDQQGTRDQAGGATKAMPLILTTAASRPRQSTLGQEVSVQGLEARAGTLHIGKHTRFPAKPRRGASFAAQPGTLDSMAQQRHHTQGRAVVRFNIIIERILGYDCSHVRIAGSDGHGMASAQRRSP